MNVSIKPTYKITSSASPSLNKTERVWPRINPKDYRSINTKTRPTWRQFWDKL